MPSYERFIPEGERKRSRRMFYTTDSAGTTGGVLAWEYLGDARRFCAAKPALRRLLGSKHSAVRKALRDGTLRMIKPGDPEIMESRALMEQVLMARFRPEAK